MSTSDERDGAAHVEPGHDGLHVESRASRFARHCLQFSSEQVLWLSEDGTIVYTNEAAIDVTGYTPDELIGRPLSFLSTFVTDAERWAERLALFASSKRVRFESAQRHKDGRTIPVEITGSIVEFEGARFVCAFVRDLSERRAAASAVSAADERTRALIEHAPEAIMVLDVESQRFVDANPPASRLFGRSRPELLSLGVHDISPPLQPDGRASDALIGEYVQRTLAGEALTIEWAIQPASGRPIECEVRLVRLPDPTRTLVRGSLVDITARKRLAHASLAISRGTASATGTAFFRVLAEQLGRALGTRFVLIARLLPGQRVRTLGLYAGGQLVPDIEYALDGTPCENVVAKNMCVYERGIQALFPRDHLLVEMGADSYIGAPIFSATGAPLGLVAVLDDRPLVEIESTSALLAIYAARAGAELERLAAEEELLRLNATLEARVAERTAALTAINAELEAFTYSVSHDLRAPLRAIHGFAEALVEDGGDQLDQTTRGHLARIQAASERMAHLIDDLLDLSRISRQALRRAPVDLSALARECVESLRRAEAAREVEVVIAEGLRTEGDASLLEVALTNLVGNAWKFTGKKPRARIEVGRATARGRDDVFFVKDDGAGFDPAYVDKLFRPFQRLHHVAEFDGTGIGLALVHRIVTRHGGQVWAEGALDRGATFYFTVA